MFKRTTDIKGLPTTVCALAIALFTVAMGINPAWARSDQPTWLQITPTSSDRFSGPYPLSPFSIPPISRSASSLRSTHYGTTLRIAQVSPPGPYKDFFTCMNDAVDAAGLCLASIMAATAFCGLPPPGALVATAICDKKLASDQHQCVAKYPHPADFRYASIMDLIDRTCNRR